MLSFVTNIFKKKPKSSTETSNNGSGGLQGESKSFGAIGIIPSMSIPHIDASYQSQDTKFRKDQATFYTAKFKEMIKARIAYRNDKSEPTSFSLLEASQAVLFSFGETSSMRGLGDNWIAISDAENPAYIRSPFKISSVVMGYTEAIAITEDGFALGCGSNSNGQVGVDRSESELKDFKIFSELIPHFIVQASCGYYFTLFLSKEGDVYGCGDNSHGQLSEGYKGLTHKIDIPEKIRSIHAGYYHSIFVSFDGNAYCCGQGFGRAITKITGIPKLISASGGYDYSFFITDQGEVYACGELGHMLFGSANGKHTTKKVEGFNHKVVTADSGYYHTLFTTQEGVVYSCGRNQYNCLNRKSESGAEDCRLFEHKNFKNIVQVSCGGYHSAALDSEGKAYLFGHSGFNQSTKEEQNQPGILKTQTTLSEMNLFPDSMKINSGGNIQLKAVCVACGGWNTMVACSPYLPIFTSKSEKEMLAKLKTYLHESPENHQLFDIDIIITNPVM
ncbi:RCC1 domain-containing protein [Naegleria gruberi]|uniref:RCC1 domain-containing protein n=1 Tax=Naegleria gruberi TaxID=5762 RepID=D2V6V1_NAEGR|nr:RCC1 domain-containing protein [Naegleria gruberi]EFC47635.1 RCC1 domain-containing protein [Naegleria gruberi]|eukprot:XP_002680379.1 RCC1 domain-containing protein [Naegleria gruberi strain NEG-M]